MTTMTLREAVQYLKEVHDLDYTENRSKVYDDFKYNDLFISPGIRRGVKRAVDKARLDAWAERQKFKLSSISVNEAVERLGTTRDKVLSLCASHSLRVDNSTGILRITQEVYDELSRILSSKGNSSSGQQ